MSGLSPVPGGGLPPYYGMQPAAAPPTVPAQQPPANFELTDLATAQRFGLSEVDLQFINALERRILDKTGNEILAFEPRDLNPQNPIFGVCAALANICFWRK